MTRIHIQAPPGGGSRNVLIALPCGEHPNELVLETGLGVFPVARWRSLGGHTDLYYAQVETPPNGGLFVGTLIDKEPVVPGFEYHPYCNDHPDDQQFHISGRWEDGSVFSTYPSSRLVRMSQVSSSVLHREFHIRRHCAPGFVFEFWATFFNRSPVVHVDGFVAWGSDSPHHDAKVSDLWIGSAEPFVALDRKRDGLPLPGRFGGLERVWQQKLSVGELPLQNGAAIPFHGNLICTPSSGLDDIDQDLGGEMLAAKEGRGFGVPSRWSGSWLAHGNLPHVEGSAAKSHAMSFRVNDRNPARDRLAPRRIGSLPRPSSTGDQEDFGSTKGTAAVVAGDPLWADLARWHVMSELYRGYFLYEPEGWEMVQARLHPDWRVHDNSTHYRTSKDTLGKAIPGWGEGRSMGFHPHDNEHDSANNLAAYYALTGDRVAERALHHRMQLMLARVHPRMGAVREVGRQLLVCAQCGVLGVEDSRQAAEQIVSAFLAQHHSRNNPKAEVFVAALQKDPRLGVWEDEGRTIPATSWNAWETGLLAVGLYAHMKVFGKRQDIHDALRRLCRTVALYAYYHHEGDWRPVNNVRWAGFDDPLPMAAYHPDSHQINDGHHSGVDRWTRQAALIGRELEHLEGADGDKAVILRVNEVFGPKVRDVPSVSDGEWTAAVRLRDYSSH